MRRTALTGGAALALALPACAGEGADAGPTAVQEQAETVVEGEPEWAAPPENEFGAVTRLDPVVFPGEDAAVGLTGMTVHSTGAMVQVAVRVHPDARDPRQDPADEPMQLVGPPPEDADGDDVLRLTIEYPDGRSATTGSRDVGPDDPRLSHRTSGGSPGSWDYDLWLWPLPEPGEQPLQVVVDWPAEGMEATAAELDVDEVAAAADRVVELWPVEREPVP